MARILPLALAATTLVLTVVAYVAVGGWHPSAAHYPIQGVDLGERPGAVEWGSVRAAGADFAYLVATVGTARRDRDFEANWRALPEAGLRRGAVHLYSLCEDGAAQADAFNATVPRTADALPPALDIALRDDCAAPTADARVTDGVRRFVTRVEAHLGKPVVLRLSRAVEKRYGLSTALVRPLWLERSFLAPNYATRPWRMWRANGWRRIDGVEGSVNWTVVAP